MSKTPAQLRDELVSEYFKLTPKLAAAQLAAETLTHLDQESKDLLWHQVNAMIDYRSTLVARITHFNRNLKDK